MPHPLRCGGRQCPRPGPLRRPDLDGNLEPRPGPDQARQFAEAIHTLLPGKLLAYNCSPSFNWAAQLSVEQMETFRKELAAMGYKSQCITLAGFRALNISMFELAKAYCERGMAGYSELQKREFTLQKDGYQAVKHQAFGGTGYFDAVQNVVTSNQISARALCWQYRRRTGLNRRLSGFNG
ncbi:hypothetical protein [Hymenobacter sp. PAMC 26628]|uniref:hypothetical protein n=1 Tax=Hymenobacter sp. PAMC 26628 TaxID=1484118 RepID=UPI002FFC69DA